MMKYTDAEIASVRSIIGNATKNNWKPVIMIMKPIIMNFRSLARSLKWKLKCMI